MSIRNPLFRTSRLFTRCFRRQYSSSPPPTYPNNNPIYVSPEILRQPSKLSRVLRWFLFGTFVALPSYWILWLGQKVSIPYCKFPQIWECIILIVDVRRLDAFQTKLTD